MLKRTTLSGFALAAALFAQTRVVTTDLQAPHKVIFTRGGNFLISETSSAVNSGRISLLTKSGSRRTLLDKLPSGLDAVGAGAGPTAMVWADALYVAIGAGDAERRGANGAAIHNPDGVSSPLASSILRVEFEPEVDNVAGPFNMTLDAQYQIADGKTVTLDDGQGSRARISLLADIPNSIPLRAGGYRFSNPWGLAYDGTYLYLADASLDALVRITPATGRMETTSHFEGTPNPGRVGPPVVDAVPTNVRVHFGDLLVSFLSGFPFTPGAGRVLAVDTASGASRPFIQGLTSAVDVWWRSRGAGERGQYFVLEFSQNQSAMPAAPGRLLRYDGPQMQVVSSDLRAPVNMLFDESTEMMYVLELTGRLLEIPIR